MEKEQGGDKDKRLAGWRGIEMNIRVQPASQPASQMRLPSFLACPQITYIFIILGSLSRGEREGGSASAAERSSDSSPPAPVAGKEKNWEAEEQKEASPINLPVISVA